MSHPLNRRARFLTGKQKGFSRVLGMADSSFSYTEKRFIETAKLLRNTTKICSGHCCENPRKFFAEKTIQGKKNDDKWKGYKKGTT